MHGERDYLREHAFRRLDMQLRKYGYSLNVMDLRGSSEEDDTIDYDERVLQMCLRRVDDCKPRMIGLLGDRYGWIFYSNKKDYTDDNAFLRAEKLAFDIADRHGLPREQMQGISVTHLEILYGLKNVDISRCFFYFRDALDYKNIPESERRFYAPDNPKKQDELKDNIRRIFGNHAKDHIRNYQAKYRTGRPLAGLEALDDMIYSDLWESFMKDIEQSQQSFSFDLHKSYLEEKSHRSVRLPLFNQVCQCIEDNENLIITGDAGSGKSVLIAQLYAAVTLEMPSVIFCAGLNATSRKEKELLKILCEQIVLLLGKTDFSDFSFPEKIENLRDLFWQLINQYATLKRKLVVFIDSIDSLETQDRAMNSLTFLPELLPDGIHFVMTSKPNTIFYRGQIPVRQIHVSSLSSHVINLLVNNIAAVFSKGLEKKVVDAASKRIIAAGGLPLYARILTEYLCQMTGKDYRSFSGNDAHIQWMLSQTASMPLAVSQAYSRIVNRAKDAYGKEITELVLAIIAISRNGMPDDLLLSVLEKVIGNIPKLITLEIRDYFFGHLRQDLNLSWWAFEHQQFQEFCFSQVEAGKQKTLHHLLIDKLDELPPENDYKKTEYLYHSLNANLHEKAIQFIASMPASSDEYIEIFFDFLGYNDRKNSNFFIEMIQFAAVENSTNSVHFFLRMIPLLGKQLNAPTISFVYLKKIMNGVASNGEKFILAPASDHKRRLIYPMSMLIKGRKALAESEFEEAINAFKQCINAIEANTSNQPSQYHHVEVGLYVETLLNLGSAYEERGELYQFTAKTYYETSLQIIEELNKSAPGKYVSDQIRITIFFARMARDTAMKAKEDSKRNLAYAESKEQYEKALALCNAAITSGNNAVKKSKVVVLEEYAQFSKTESNGVGNDNKEQINEALKLAKDAYTSRPDDISAILSYVSVCETNAKLFHDKTLAKEAFEILHHAIETIPDRPKITKKMAELAITLAELEMKDDNPNQALTYYMRVLAPLAMQYEQTGEFAYYSRILLHACELARKIGDLNKEAVLREETLVAFEKEIAKKTDDFQNCIKQQLILMWELFLFYEKEKIDTIKADSSLNNLKEKLLEIVSKRMAQQPGLRMQVGHKLHAVAVTLYQNNDPQNAYLLWEKAADTLDELIDFFPGETSYTHLRKQVLDEIVTLLSYNSDPKVNEWSKRFDLISLE